VKAFFIEAFREVINKHAGAIIVIVQGRWVTAESVPDGVIFVASTDELSLRIASVSAIVLEPFNGALLAREFESYV
jgi:hypothetical protein